MNNRKTGTEEYAALIGMDWADEKHDVWLWDVATGGVGIEWWSTPRKRWPNGSENCRHGIPADGWPCVWNKAEEH